MKKTVKGNSMVCYQGTMEEHLSDYMHLFEKYFKNVAHHHHVNHYINKDAILIYSYFPIELSCNGCSHSSKDFNISRTSTMKISSVFYEIRARNISCTNVDKIYYDKKLFGYYCSKNNVFCVGDIAHEIEQEEHIYTILEKMEKGGYLIRRGKNEKKQTITLGADPEMETMVDGVVVSAFDLPQISTRDKIYLSHDGHTQPQRELRPDPANSPEELVENIRDLIKISSFFGEDLSVVGKTLSLGGHIHIGNATPSKELIDVLDYFLFPLNEFNTPLRKASRYGRLGDVRAQPHGFEYRTPPAAWLLTPTLAKMTLELTKNVVEKIINEIDVDISDNFDIEEYKYNIEQLGFNKEWVVQFMDEIMWAKSHLNEPLAKTWGVEIPQKYKIKKIYRDKIRYNPRPRIIIDEIRPQPTFISLDEEEDGEYEE